MAPSYIANFVLVLGVVLQMLGIHVADADLQTTVVTILAVVIPLFTMIRQLVTGRSTVLGGRPTQK